MKMTIFDGIGNMILIAIFAMLIVLVAMVVDLFSGIRKAKIRGEYRSSKALKRTFTKFITYEGGMIIAVGIDLLIHLSHLVNLFGLEAIYAVPVITCLAGVFLLVVEYISVREKADQKTKKQMEDAAKLFSDILQNENIRDMMVVAMENQKKKKEEVNDENS